MAVFRHRFGIHFLKSLYLSRRREALRRTLPHGAQDGKEDVYIWMDRWRKFMEVYYGAEILEIEEMWYDDGSAEFFLPFYLGEEELFQMGLYLYCRDGIAVLSSMR